jgi:hypothetical protein
MVPMLVSNASVALEHQRQTSLHSDMVLKYFSSSLFIDPFLFFFLMGF